MTEQSASPKSVLDALVNTENAIADFIANGPSTGIAGHIRDGYRNRCNQFANAPAWAQALGNGPTGTLGRICQPWYDAQGKDGPTINTPAFTGGQCAVQYVYRLTSATVQRQGCPSPTFSQTVTGLPVDVGPVTGPITNVEGRATDENIFFCASRGVNHFTTARLFLEGASGSASVVLGPGDSQADVIGVTFTGSLVRVDGLPDNCGNPPETLEPGADPPTDPGPTDGPEPTDDPNNPFGPPLLPIPPYDDPLGGPTPIEGPDGISNPIGPDDLPGSTEAQPGGPENIGDPIAVEPAPGEQGEQTDFGTPPAGQVWVGALLRFEFPEELGSIPGTFPTNTVIPRTIGNASLVFGGGRGTAFPIRSASFDVFRPSPALEVQGVYVNVLPGITYTVSPVSIAKCPENLCAEDD